jgi:hypothetical protein
MGEMHHAKGSVILVHGIQTRADWYRDVRDCLIDDGFSVHLTNYGWFDLFRFLIPFNVFRNQVKSKIFRQIRAAIRDDPSGEYSIIAHSFGTYIVSHILKDEFDIKIARIIFAGSVVRYDFPFEQLPDRFRDNILNEVATRDPWPALAESVTTGYGSAGTFGFKRPPVFDRWHVGDHSDVLNACHCRKYWLPFLNAGTIEKTTASPKVPIWIRFLNTVRVKYWIALAFVYVLLMGLAIWSYGAPPVTLQAYPGESGWQLSDPGLAKTVNADMDRPCPVAWLFGEKCDGWHARWITGRSWRGVQNYDHSLNNILFPKELLYTYRDPERFWRDLSDAYPSCILITEVMGHLRIARNENCTLETVK